MKLSYEASSEACCRIRIGKKQVQFVHGDSVYYFKKTKGWRYLCALLEYPGVIFRPWHLEQSENESYSSMQLTTTDASQNGDLQYCDLLPSQPLADTRAIHEIKQRLCSIIDAIALAKQHGDYAAMDDLMTDKEALEQYLLQVYSPRGRIREFPNEQRQQKQRVVLAIMRAVQQLQAVDADLARYLNAHLKLGNWLQYAPGELEMIVQQY